MRFYKTLIGAALSALLLAGSTVTPPKAQASTNGRRNTAIGLGAASLYELLNHKTTNGVLLGAGAAYAYKKYDDSRRNDRRRTSYNSYRSYSRYGGASYSGPTVYRRTTYRRVTTYRPSYYTTSYRRHYRTRRHHYHHRW